MQLRDLVKRLIPESIGASPRFRVGWGGGTGRRRLLPWVSFGGVHQATCGFMVKRSGLWAVHSFWMGELRPVALCFLDMSCRLLLVVA